MNGVVKEPLSDSLERLVEIEITIVTRVSSAFVLQEWRRAMQEGSPRERRVRNGRQSRQAVGAKYMFGSDQYAGTPSRWRRSTALVDAALGLDKQEARRGGEGRAEAVARMLKPVRDYWLSAFDL